jgi:glycogen operon protein
MLLMGDEVRRTQGGNNNAYCQDDETSWFDWTLLSRQADLHRFVTLLNRGRLLRDVEHEHDRVALNELLRRADIMWHGVRLHEPDWRPSSHSLAFTTKHRPDGVLLHVILNAYWQPLSFDLPPLAARAGAAWRRWVDTSLESPQDIVEWYGAPLVDGTSYLAEPRSAVVLFSDGRG